MNTVPRVIVFPIALALAVGAFANDQTSNTNSGDSDAAVARLKSSLPSSAGFAVDNVRMTSDGVACIKYHVANNQGGQTRGQAVVQGDDVVRSTTQSSQFAKEWNGKCAGTPATASNDASK